MIHLLPTPPLPQRLTLLDLPSEIQVAICSQIDQYSWNRLRDALGSSPSSYRYYHVSDDREPAITSDLISDSRKEMAMVETMTRVNRHFRRLLTPYLYSRYGLQALRHCLVHTGRETLLRYFKVTGRPCLEDLDQLLINASAFGNHGIAQELIYLGADRSKFKPEMPLHVQTEEDQVAYRLPLTLQLDPDVFNRGLHGATPLLAGVRCDANYGFVMSLLGDKAKLNQTFPDGSLALHEAITTSAQYNVWMLLHYGADPNKKDMRRGRPLISIHADPTAMETALLRGTERIFLDLLAFGADIKDDRVSENARHMLEVMALQGEGWAVAQAMFSSGLPMTLTTPNNGESFLHCAAEGGSFGWLYMLVNLFKVDVNALTKYNNTPIEWAEGRPDVQEWLLEHGSLPPRREKYDPYADDDYEIMDESE